jgi:hypothetical protein
MMLDGYSHLQPDKQEVAARKIDRAEAVVLRLDIGLAELHIPACHLAQPLRRDSEEIGGT